MPSNIGEAKKALIAFGEVQLIERTKKNVDAAMVVVHGRAIRGLKAVDTGQLRASTRVKTVVVGKDEVRGVLYNTLKYAPYVHQGTGIYAVDGNGRKTPWFWEGHTKKWEGGHMTVGQKPSPWIKKGFEDSLADITRILSRG